MLVQPIARHADHVDGKYGLFGCHRPDPHVKALQRGRWNRYWWIKYFSPLCAPWFPFTKGFAAWTLSSESICLFQGFGDSISLKFHLPLNATWLQPSAPWHNARDVREHKEHNTKRLPFLFWHFLRRVLITYTLSWQRGLLASWVPRVWWWQIVSREEDVCSSRLLYTLVEQSYKKTCRTLYHVCWDWCLRKEEDDILGIVGWHF